MSTIKKDKVTVRQAILPIRALFHHLKLFFLLIMAVGVLVISRVEPAAMSAVRTGVMDTVTPLLTAISHPVASWHTLQASLAQTLALYHENIRLRQENAQLTRMRAITLELQAENARLRQLVRFVPDAATDFVTARIVGDAATPYAKSALVNAGSAEGVKEGQVVYNRQGLIGRVTEMGVHNARVLLLTDINSRVPVMGEASREHAVLAGNNSETAELLHLPIESTLSVGERVVTSGDGGYFPQGIAVGVVTSVTETGAQVTPYVDWARMEDVTVAGVRGVAVPAAPVK